MRNKPAVLMKQVFSIIITTTKAKSNALKSQLHTFSLLYKKKLPVMSSISNKIDSATAKERERSNTPGSDYSKAVMMYNTVKTKCTEGHNAEEEDDGLGDGTGSVIDLVKNSREDNTDFNLEDEINLVADVYIRRFHKKMRMKKQESFKLDG